MSNRLKALIAATTVSLLSFVGTAQAAAIITPVTCGNLTLGTRTLTVTPDLVTTRLVCTAAGLGNLGDDKLEDLPLFDEVLERDDDAADEKIGLLNITGRDGYSGTWSVASSVWTGRESVYLYFFFGRANGLGTTHDPDHFIVKLIPVIQPPPGNVSGRWAVAPANGGALSNVVLMVGPPTNRVPEPGTMALVGLGLAGLALAGRRRKS